MFEQPMMSPSDFPMNGGEKQSNDTPPFMEGAGKAAPKRSRKGLILALVLIVVFLVAGAVGAYYFVNVLSKTPERVVGEMFVAMQSVTSASVEATLQGAGTGVSKSPIYATNGDDRAAKDYTMAIVTNFQFDDPVELFSGTLSLTASVEGDPVTTLTSEVRSVDGADYVRLSALTTPVVPEALQSSVTRGLNRWIVIDKNEIAKSLKLDKFLAQLETAGNATSTNAAVQVAINTYLPQAITITDELPIERMNGASAYHYAYALNKNAVGEMLNAIEAATGGEDELTEIRTFLGESSDVTGEMWIGKSDAMLYKLTVNTTLKGTPQFAIALTVTLSEYGATFTVDAPESPTPIEDLLLEMLEQAAAEAKADDDNDGLQNSDEDKHGTDRANPDTDGDGYMDGAEVEGGYNPNGEGKLKI